MAKSGAALALRLKMTKQTRINASHPSRKSSKPPKVTRDDGFAVIFYKSLHVRAHVIRQSGNRGKSVTSCHLAFLRLTCLHENIFMACFWIGSFVGLVRRLGYCGHGGYPIWRGWVVARSVDAAARNRGRALVQAPASLTVLRKPQPLYFPGSVANRASMV